MGLHIRAAIPQDSAALLRIYAPYVMETTVTFEFDVPSEREFRGRIEYALDRFVYLVLEEDTEDGGVPIGYAYYGAFGERAAYQWSVETSIYLDRSRCGGGLGTVLLEALERCMVAQGITNSQACITSENTGSIEFHRGHGYAPCAEFSNCASKFGRWLSVTWMEKQVAAHVENPSPIYALSADDLQQILNDANRKLEQLNR